MEFLIALAVLFFGGAILRAILRTFKAAGKAVIGKGNLKDNLDLEFRGFGDLRTRLNEVQKPNEPFLLEVEVRGLFPVYSTINAGFVISAFTKNESGDLTPVFSMLKEFQEPETRAFQNLTGCGQVSENQGFTDWVRIGVIPMEILQPSISGRQELSIVIRLVDFDNQPNITFGFSEPEPLWASLEVYGFNFKINGYSEEADARDKSQALAINIGMAVAMADGNLDDSEGLVLKNWIKSILSNHTGEKEQSLKETFNNAMRESYNLAKSGNLKLEEVCKELNEIGDTAQKYHAIELAHKVMAADGIVDQREMKIIHSVADLLDIDSSDLEKIRDKQIINLNTNPEDIDTLSLLGISPSLSNEEIIDELKKEFIKWNGRLNTLGDGKEKDNAQQMLDLIGKARDKHNK
jgi:tellurite resistance protein